MSERRPFHHGSSKQTFALAQSLKRESTLAERILWEQLRSRKLLGIKFRRQHPLAGFIADFYAHKLNLVIEVDGDIHKETEVAERDKERTCVFNDLGITVIRFTNDEVIHDMLNVLIKISSYKIN